MAPEVRLSQQMSVKHTQGIKKFLQMLNPCPTSSQLLLVKHQQYLLYVSQVQEGAVTAV